MASSLRALAALYRKWADEADAQADVLESAGSTSSERQTTEVPLSVLKQRARWQRASARRRAKVSAVSADPSALTAPAQALTVSADALTGGEGGVLLSSGSNVSLFQAEEGQSSAENSDARASTSALTGADRQRASAPKRQRPASALVSASSAPPGFLRFWQAWPSNDRKVDRKGCCATWNRRGLEQHADAIVAHVQACAQSEQWQSGYAPQPKTYLNQDRWEAPPPPKLGKAATALTPAQAAVKRHNDATDWSDYQEKPR